MNELINVTIADAKDARLDMDVWGDCKRVRKVIARKFGELNRQVRCQGAHVCCDVMGRGRHSPQPPLKFSSESVHGRNWWC
jgi:hypothetical protein